MKPACLKTYASEVLPLEGPPKLDWSRVTGHTGTVPGEACVSEDLCQWSVTPGRSTQAGLGQSPLENEDFDLEEEFDNTGR